MLKTPARKRVTRSAPIRCRNGSVGLLFPLRWSAGRSSSVFLDVLVALEGEPTDSDSSLYYTYYREKSARLKRSAKAGSRAVLQELKKYVQTKTNFDEEQTGVSGQADRAYRSAFKPRYAYRACRCCAATPVLVRQHSNVSLAFRGHLLACEKKCFSGKCCGRVQVQRFCFCRCHYPACVKTVIAACPCPHARAAMEASSGCATGTIGLAPQDGLQNHCVQL